jgi:hypothetical protein
MSHYARRNQHPDTVVITFLGAARVLVAPFIDAKLLVDRFDDLAEPWHVKAVSLVSARWTAPGPVRSATATHDTLPRFS